MGDLELNALLGLKSHSLDFALFPKTSNVPANIASNHWILLGLSSQLVLNLLYVKRNFF
jgi:hypothetical protein